MTTSTLAVRKPLVLADLVPGARLRDVALVVGGAAFVGLAAQLSVPIPGTPVPVTAQTLAVLLSCAALGTVRGVASMLLYMVAGIAGVPWFAGHQSGFAMPSFGYIAGYVLAAAAVGALASRGWDRSPLRTAATMVVGNLVIYAAGVTWLAGAVHVSLAQAVVLGVLPFLVGDAIKIVVAMGLLPAAWKLSGRRRA